MDTAIIIILWKCSTLTYNLINFSLRYKVGLNEAYYVQEGFLIHQERGERHFTNY